MRRRSRGTGLKNETAVVSSWNAWSIEYPGGAFLLKRSVVEARIVDHIDISDQ